MRSLVLFFIAFFSPIATLHSAEMMRLSSNVQRANSGDFIVTLQDKTCTLLRVDSRSPAQVTMEEISIPLGKVPKQGFSWREWVRQGAPMHTCWVRYRIAVPNGNIAESYALSTHGWYSINLSESFLPGLLNIPFTRVSEASRPKTGSGAAWSPPMIVDGQRVPGVAFDVWRTLWPKDGTVLANKTIDVYLPRGESYPTHFPYWLQIQGGIIGNTQIRIIDSGKGLESPAPPLPNNMYNRK